MISRFTWRLQVWLNQLVYHERSASRVRLLFLFFLTLSMTLLGYTLFEDPLDPRWIEDFRTHYAFFTILPELILRFGHFMFYGFRHMIIPVAAFLGALLASAFYVQDVYELPSFRLGLQYIVASFLGFWYPRLTISDGERQIPEGTVNLIDTIGGPGIVRVQPGNVVLFESLRAPSRVVANSTSFVSRFETIREIVSLDDQHGFIKEASAKTKDGIEMIVRDVHYRYRLRTGRRAGDHQQREAQDPYPFSVQAVKAMAYNRSVRTTGLTSWHTTVRLAVDSAITDYIKAHHFDHLTAPSAGDDPRAEIAKRMMGQGIRSRLRGVGAELLWFDIGHFDVATRELEEKKIETIRDLIEAQRVDTWSARWDGEAIVVRSQGESRRLVYQDMGHAEGQADLLISIMQSLNDANPDDVQDNPAQRLRDLRAIVWTSVAQILDAAAEDKKKSLTAQSSDDETSENSE